MPRVLVNVHCWTGVESALTPFFHIQAHAAVRVLEPAVVAASSPPAKPDTERTATAPPSTSPRPMASPKPSGTPPPTASPTTSAGHPHAAPPAVDRPARSCPRSSSSATTATRATDPPVRARAGVRRTSTSPGLPHASGQARSRHRAPESWRFPRHRGMGPSDPSGPHPRVSRTAEIEHVAVLPRLPLLRRPETRDWPPPRRSAPWARPQLLASSAFASVGKQACGRRHQTPAPRPTRESPQTWDALSHPGKQQP
jgi:hypothetical protein